jgi:hypothetical protein
MDASLNGRLLRGGGTVLRSSFSSSDSSDADCGCPYGGGEGNSCGELVISALDASST